LAAWISTIVTLNGGVANLIEAEKARSSAEYQLTFLGYIIYGLSSTMIILYVCLPIVYFTGHHVLRECRRTVKLYNLQNNFIAVVI
jgi:hypothetical protein